MGSNKAGRYLKYALGEIILVVLGILIALSINNWQQEIKNKKLERRYLTDLLGDLRKDSVMLNTLYSESIRASASKDSLVAYLENSHTYTESIPEHFREQWNPYKVFTPNETTIEEMKSSSNVSIIRNDNLRRSIVELYSNYDYFLQDEGLYMASTRDIFKMAKETLVNINEPSPQELETLLRSPLMSNTIRKNFANGRMESVGAISGECHSVMEKIKDYLNSPN